MLPRRSRGAELAERLEHDLVVCLGRDLRKHLRDLALGVDQEGRAADAEVGLAVHLLLAPDAIEVGDLVVLVGEEGEVEAVLVGEVSLCLDRVRRDTDDSRAGAGVVVAVVAHAARLGRTTRRVRLREEVEDDWLPTQRAQGDLVAALIRRGEAVSLLTDRAGGKGSWTMA